MTNCLNRNSLHGRRFSFCELTNRKLFFIEFWGWFFPGLFWLTWGSLGNPSVVWVFFTADSESCQSCVRNALDTNFSMKACWFDWFACLPKFQTSQWDFCTLWNRFVARFQCSRVLEFRFQRFQRVSFWRGMGFLLLFQECILLPWWSLRIQQRKIL